MSYLRHIISTGIACGLLMGCSSGTVKHTLGLERGTPDEFRVVSRPPLSMPPQFNLRPPSTTDSGPGQVPASDQAQSLVTGKPGSAAAADTPVASKPLKSASAPAGKAESQFLKNAGAGQADPRIRDQLLADRAASQPPEEEDSSWWNIFSSSQPKKESVVNAKGEANRIKTDEEAGQPVTTGDTPVVKEKDTGVLGRIFGY